MFEDSLVESGGRFAHRNPWTTAFSFAGQAALLAGLLLLSLFYNEALPMRTLISSLQAPPPTQPAPLSTQTVRTTTQVSALHSDALMAPSRIPVRILPGQDQPAAPGSDAPPIPGVLTGDGSGSNPLADLLPKMPPSPTKPEAPQKVRVSSGVAQGLLVRQVKPQYPSLALQARVQGTVVLQAVIGKDGTVQELHVVSGHPLLNGPAIAAVKQWLYRPYYLNGEPVAVDTQINVNFTLE
jgi:protein TonB